MAINAAIVGATGYTGQELLDILLGHPHVTVAGLYSTTENPQPIAKLVPRFHKRTQLVCKKLDVSDVINAADIIFLALPHTQAMEVVPQLLKAKKYVIDLSADYRLKDVRVYEAWYGKKHKDPAKISLAVYGLCELYRGKIQSARFVANPGCYPTAALLGLAPLAATEALEPGSVIIDAKSGASGAGKKAAQELLFNELDEDFRAYKVNAHQHMPEIEQELSKLSGKKTAVRFVPHLLPLKRGILETIYVTLSGKARKADDVLALYKKFYKAEPFVRIKEEGFPSLKDVCCTNFCDIGVQSSGNNVIIISAIDNLVKGAAGQAVQNMNIMMGYPETAGLL